MNYLYKYTFFEEDLQKHSEIINLVRKAVNDKSEIVYLGESSNTTFRSDDVDKRSISSMISEYFPTKKFGLINKEASHAGIYYELLRNIPENSSIKTVIITLNMRAFDANWIYSNLETPLQKSIVLLKDYPPLFNRFLLAFKGYDIKTDVEREKQFKKKWKNDVLHFPYPVKYLNVTAWDSMMWSVGIKNIDGSKNQPLSELACHYIKTYAFQIDTITNPRIKDFDKIVLLAQNRKWNLVFNLMAENIEMADSLVGNDLVFLLKQNRDLLVKRYHKNGVFVVDNLEQIPNSEFIDQNWTTEHYAEKGRAFIAKNVAETLKNIYPNDYSKISTVTSIPKEFINDCEGNTTWGQMQTLSTDKSFSGLKSSKVDKKHEFSITFESAIKNLPDSLKQIAINFQLYQTDLNHDAKLVIEISGKKTEYQWNGFSIKEFSKTINTWDKVNYTFTLPSNFYKGDLVKVYINNPSNSIVYIDDFKIKFNK